MKNWPEKSPKWPQKWKIYQKNQKFWKKWFFLKSSDNLQKNQKLNQKFPPNDLKNEKLISNDNFEKNGKFWKSSDNLEEIKNLPKNSPQMISKLKNWHQKWKFWKKWKFLKYSENLEKK